MSDTEEKALKVNWKSPHGEQNVSVLRAEHADVFSAIAEIDALGHRVLKRAADGARIDGMDGIVGVSLLRRAVTAYVGVRHLLESSAVQPAMSIARMQLEVFLGLRYLVYGGRRHLSLGTQSSPRMRETRARYFMAASIRTGIYRRKALLDGAQGADRARKENREALRNEIKVERARLERSFKPQQARFGPLRCFPTGNDQAGYSDRRQWYSFGFPSGRINSVRDLAERFGYGGQYFLIYSPFSEFGHAGGISHDAEIDKGKVGIKSPHDPRAFSFIAFWTSSWQRMILASATKAYCPNAHADLVQVYESTKGPLDSVESEAKAFVLG